MGYLSGGAVAQSSDVTAVDKRKWRPQSLLLPAGVYPAAAAEMLRALAVRQRASTPAAAAAGRTVLANASTAEAAGGAAVDIRPDAGGTRASTAVGDGRGDAETCGGRAAASAAARTHGSGAAAEPHEGVLHQPCRPARPQRPDAASVGRARPCRRRRQVRCDARRRPWREEAAAAESEGDRRADRRIHQEEKRMTTRWKVWTSRQRARWEEKRRATSMHQLCHAVAHLSGPALLVGSPPRRDRPPPLLWQGRGDHTTAPDRRRAAGRVPGETARADSLLAEPHVGTELRPGRKQQKFDSLCCLCYCSRRRRCCCCCCATTAVTLSPACELPRPPRVYRVRRRHARHRRTHFWPVWCLQVWETVAAMCPGGMCDDDVAAGARIAGESGGSGGGRGEGLSRAEEPFALILEDDVRFHRNWRALLETALNKLPCVQTLNQQSAEDGMLCLLHLASCACCSLSYEATFAFQGQLADVPARQQLPRWMGSWRDWRAQGRPLWLRECRWGLPRSPSLNWIFLFSLSLAVA